MTIDSGCEMNAWWSGIEIMGHYSRKIEKSESGMQKIGNSSRINL